MSQKFFITTPIYYSNAIPHIGNAYASFLADIIARYKRLEWSDVKFSTGVDENSQKVVESASAQGMEVMEYADMMAGKHREIWDSLSIGYTDFIRTTSKDHTDFVQKILQETYDRGDIYEWVYEGLYCVGCESFKKETDLIEKDGKKVCPDHPNKTLEHLKEKNYFFRLSKYQDWLLDFYEKHPDFIVPSSRYNEVREFVKWGLEDFSISRETNTFGIPLPFDPTQVTYVWYDALLNYVSVCGDEQDKWWPADLHVIGKDIAKFHAIYWPAMLHAVWYEPPTRLLTTGFFTVDGQKMSKSIGNVINPVEYIDTYSRDMLILYLFTAFPIGEDGNFDQKEAILQYNAKLSNNLWNLLNRVLTLSLKLWGRLSGYEESLIAGKRDDYQSKYTWHMETYDLKSALDESFAFATELNQYIDMVKPWKLDIESESERESLDQCLSTVAVGLAYLAYNLSPFFEEKMKELLSRIGVKQGWEVRDGFQIQEKWEPLYMRLDLQ